MVGGRQVVFLIDTILAANNLYRNNPLAKLNLLASQANLISLEQDRHIIVNMVTFKKP